MNAKRNLISMLDLKNEEIEAMLSEAAMLEGKSVPYTGKSAVLLFNRPSTRTLVSFEVALKETGFSTIHLDYMFTQLVGGEKLHDTAKAFSQYVQLIVARLHPHSMLLELASASLVPVISAGSDVEHPCQALGDLYTMKKLNKLGKGKKIVFVGDPKDSVANSLSIACLKLGMEFVFLAPKGYYQSEEYAKHAKKFGNITLTSDTSALKGADVVYTNDWAKGSEAEITAKIKDFTDYQVNDALLALAKKDAIVMHPLPASRGLEISEAVLDGKQSVVWQQAKNRLYVQKAIIKMLA
jgi:ornithine carbamoyltransferase